MTRLRAWVRASRFPSQSYIFLPLLLGQGLGLRGDGLSWDIFALVHLFGLFLQLYIVYANDVADRETDRANTTATLFSGGSRVLVQGLLRPGQLRAAALATAALGLCCSVALWLVHGRWLCPPLAALALLLLWLYSFGPVRLSYRGGGELLQMLGVGGVLPVFGYHAQSGAVADFPWALLLALLPSHLACALATTLPDEPSDRGSCKRTAAVLLGPRVIMVTIVVLDLAAAAAYARLGSGRGGGWWWLLALSAAAGLAQLPLLGSRPGSRGLSLLVGLAVLSTLSLVAAMTWALWGRP